MLLLVAPVATQSRTKRHRARHCSLLSRELCLTLGQLEGVCTGAGDLTASSEE